MKTYVVANQKGGISKTTTSIALADILKRRGNTVLFIDADQQGNATDTYKGEIEGMPTLYDVLLGDHIKASEAIQKTINGDIIASDPLLREADSKLSSDPEGEYRMSMALEGLEGYDYVVIDTAPALNWILRNCLIAADEVIIPVTADRYGLQGLASLAETIGVIRKRQNKGLSVAGLLLTKYNGRTNLSREIKDNLEEIASSMDTKLFDTTIRESVKVREAQAMRKMLFDYAKNCSSALDYEDFVDELTEGED